MFVAKPETLGASNTFFWAMATGIYWLFLLFFMHSPSDFLPGDILLTGDTDLWLHGFAYFGFALLLCRTAEAWSMERSSGRNPPLSVYAAVFLGCVAYGYLDEQTQPLTGRTRETADWEADVLGALAGVLVCLVLQIFFVVETHSPAYYAAQYALGEQKRRRRRRRHRDHQRRRHHKRREETPDNTPPQNSVPPQNEPLNEPKPDAAPPTGETSAGEGSPER
ncbi:MAG: hypothetical protein C0483_22780 [Pirellula sp.]|nr:hypothetical protein [Pirellula sp.]